MTILDIDIETYSSYPLSECGVHRYVEAPDFDILLFSWSEDDGPVQVADLALGEQIPAHVVEAIYDPTVVKYAHNAAFEQCCLSKYLGRDIDVRQWECTMLMCARLGFPLALGQAADVLRLPQQKMKEGAALIRYFCMPATSGRNKGNRNMPADHLDKWNVFKEYCGQDVATEASIRQKLQGIYTPPAWERRLYEVDYEVNKRGVRVDLDLATRAVDMAQAEDQRLLAEARELTGLDNPNSVTQAKYWIAEKMHLTAPPTSLDKNEAKRLLSDPNLHPDVRRYLEIRAQLAKTSVKKYQAILNSACNDGRIRGLLQYYGTFTGRWAGRLVQMQNLPQNHLAGISVAREMLKDSEAEMIEITYGDVKQTLSELIRTTFIPADGSIFHVCDFSAIEARVLAWVAGEEWVLEVFRTHGKIYEATASRMFHVPVEEIHKGDWRRQRGKIAQLALGYGGGVGALDAMDPTGIIPENEKKSTVRSWRNANPNVVAFWHTIEDAAVRAIQTKIPQRINKDIRLEYRHGSLAITLPSGHTVFYPRARVEMEMMAYGEKTIITYERLNQETRKWERARTYGGKLTENVIQAIARDILSTVLLREHDAGYNVVFHVHDETITEVQPSVGLDAIEAIFSQPIAWAEGLPLKGAGYSGSFYFKD